MQIISFAWTVSALMAGFKTCTRRHWNDGYASRFRCGIEVQGWDRLPRAGGQAVAIVRLTVGAYLERTSKMPDSDFEAEGLGWMERQGMMMRGMPPRQYWEEWKAADDLVYVVRFQLMKRLVPRELYLPTEQ